jgi:hypothetical protein
MNGEAAERIKKVKFSGKLLIHITSSYLSLRNPFLSTFNRGKIEGRVDHITSSISIKRVTLSVERNT